MTAIAERTALQAANLYDPETQRLDSGEIQEMIKADLAPIGEILSITGIFTRTRDFGVIMDNVHIKVKHPALRVPIPLKARWDRSRKAIAYRSNLELPERSRESYKNAVQHEFYGEQSGYGTGVDRDQQLVNDIFSRWSADPVFSQKDLLGVTSRAHRRHVERWNSSNQSTFNDVFESEFERGAFLNHLLLLCQNKGLTNVENFMVADVGFMSISRWKPTLVFPETAEYGTIPAESMKSPLVSFRASWEEDNGDTVNYRYDGRNIFIPWSDGNERAAAATLV